MHFAFWNLSTSPNPLVQRYFTIYYVIHISLQIFGIIAVIYHGKMLNRGFDGLFPFHIFLVWMVALSNVFRFVQHSCVVTFNEWMDDLKREESVGRFDGVMAALWATPYIMVPFALSGGYEYRGFTWLIPLPMIVGLYSASRILYNLKIAFFDKKYQKLRSALPPNEDGLPLYEEQVSPV